LIQEEKVKSNLTNQLAQFFIPTTNPKKNQNLRFYTIAEFFRIFRILIYCEQFIELLLPNKENVKKKVLVSMQTSTHISLGTRSHRFELRPLKKFPGQD